MEWIEAKTILTKVNYGQDWYGIDYNMNLYRGCCHGCIYCDSRSDCYHIPHFDKVRGKQNACAILEKKLQKKKKKGVVGIGSMSDTYNPLEEKYELTRNALKLLYQYQYGVSIDTKSDLIIRDMDILEAMHKQSSVIVKFTITTADDALSKIIEPHVCSSSKRFAAIRALSDRGIFVGIMLNPVLPFLTDTEENIKKIVFLAYQSGAKFIHTYMGMTLRENQRVYYYQMLDKYFPGIKEKYQKFYHNRYHCTVPHAQKLYEIFTKECQKYHLLYKMEDIIKAYKKEAKQMTLFDV